MEEAAPSSASTAEQESGTKTSVFSSPASLLSQRNTEKNQQRLSRAIRGVDDNDEEENSEGKRTTATVGAAQESVFLNMYIRKMDRRVNGQYQNSLYYEITIVVVLAIMILFLQPEHGEDIVADLRQINMTWLIYLPIYIAFILAVRFMLGTSNYVRTMRWMLIYIPLLFWAIWVFILRDIEESDQRDNKPTIFLIASFICLEVLTFCGFVIHFRPSSMKTDWLRKQPGRVRKFWKIRAAVADDPWTMSYRGHNPKYGITKCNLDYMCKYEGAVDERSGLPDGLGRWIDDTVEGEMLTGYWDQGKPVAPFSSWQVGSDNAVEAVRVAYFKATDDPFSKNKIRPTNHLNHPECGVASVECSISGSFYTHLPRTTLIEGPYVADAMPTPQNNPVGKALSHMFQTTEKDDSAIHICAADKRGVQVLGHVYEPTGRYFSSNGEISVCVEWGSCEGGTNADATNDRNEFAPAQSRARRETARELQKSLFMPKPTRKPLSKLVQVEVEDSSDEDNSHAEDERGDDGASSTDLDLVGHSTTQMTRQTSIEQKTATLRVRDWAPTKFKEALIFCHGYNSCMKKSLNTMGQFLAMTKLSRYVYPIVFVWPGSTNVGYPYASKISATDINQQNMLKLVRGLREAGIRSVHFLTHSMGAQSLMGAFRDKYDAKGIMTGRSDVSKEFTLDPDFDTTKGPREGKRHAYSDRMTCRSITLMNPDFPVNAFVDRGFETIRRICSTITVVGDKRDRALGFSSWMNKVAPHYGYEQPQVLWPTIAAGPGHKPKSLVKRIGRSVEDLYFPPHLAREHLEKGNGEAFHRLLFNKAPLKGQMSALDTKDRFWLDIDVIDMTGLDTNIKGMRHNGFSLNGMLLKDLQELFSTGKRAMSRSTLLYREGNQFSFVRAPAFVV